MNFVIYGCMYRTMRNSVCVLLHVNGIALSFCDNVAYVAAV